MKNKVELLDVVALINDLPEHNLERGEIGTVVECYDSEAFEVEFVTQDGYTYALLTLRSDQIIPLRQKRTHSDKTTEPAIL